MVIQTSAVSESQIMTQFEKGELKDWTEKVFSNKTLYKIINLDDRKAIQAVSNNSASGLFKEININLEKTPYLNWSWKITNTLKNTNEKSKQGDDYPARVYVIFSGGLFFWRTQSLNYVWSSSQEPGSHWPNAYTDNTHMIAVNSGNQQSGRWIHAKRNVRDDYKEFFGSDITSVDAIAIMTDTDNTGLQAISYYGPIYFSSE